MGGQCVVWRVLYDSAVTPLENQSSAQSQPKGRQTRRTPSTQKYGTLSLSSASSLRNCCAHTQVDESNQSKLHAVCYYPPTVLGLERILPCFLGRLPKNVGNAIAAAAIMTCRCCWKPHPVLQILSTLKRNRSGIPVQWRRYAIGPMRLVKNESSSQDGGRHGTRPNVCIVQSVSTNNGAVGQRDQVSLIALPYIRPDTLPSSFYFPVGKFESNRQSIKAEWRKLVSARAIQFITCGELTQIASGN
jgi:hypothetical protein